MALVRDAVILSEMLAIGMAGALSSSSSHPEGQYRKGRIPVALEHPAINLQFRNIAKCR
jgi:hypothetical protein